MSIHGLSKREVQVVTLLLEGKSNKQIAASLGISEGTVEFHLTSIYAKIGVSSRVEAVILLRQPGFSLDNTKLTDIGETPGGKNVNHGETPGEIVTESEYDNNKRTLQERDDGMTGKKTALWKDYWIQIILMIAFILMAVVVSYLYLSMPKSWNGYERECEYPDQGTVGQAIGRSNASGNSVHGQFGVVNADPWSALAGVVVYDNISTPRVEQLYLKLRYSKNSPASVPILIYLDDEKTPRASIYPEDLKDWNRFTWTDLVFLGSIDNGAHSITFSTIGQQYGVADLDTFVLTAGSP